MLLGTAINTNLFLSSLDPGRDVLLPPPAVAPWFCVCGVGGSVRKGLKGAGAAFGCAVEPKVRRRVIYQDRGTRQCLPPQR